ncbi:competence type IV pilus minor pilin ComGF [Alteribacillus bidgolensis]|uniref:Prepilin-type N-terminal cleavage/methylation domain-containing protein n=1 Tax=Alteribacillus bidgolensis TaxID=930129 RepID=A0A1G8BNB8_9BACI|nr:competence type IV pilus minor pilin ComGF [Alteribacillus bidgolensis]SDH34060.1 prepilin-type N-terminal cleavage/methylation domain-containing protein [Alteribacillus bidgolensis]
MKENMKNVFLCYRKNHGMTLIEVLTALTITLVCISIIIFYVPLFKASFQTSGQDIHMFFQQIKDDLNDAFQIQINENELLIFDHEESYRYYRSNSNIIRSKSGAGYEIVLQGVKKLEASYQDYGADLKITDTNGVEWDAALGFRPSVERRIKE